MRLIIDIPEKVVTAIQHSEDYRYDIHTAIAQGVPYEERPTGHWEYVTHYSCRYRVCSVCHAEKLDDRATGWNYCQHCGADMRGGRE